MPRQSATRWAASTIALGAWLAMIAAGFRAIEDHETTPGSNAPVPPSWPMSSTLGFVPHRPNVVMAVHPRCPCSRASLSLLRAGVQGASSYASIRLLVYRPEDAGAGWAGGSSLSSGAGQGGATSIDDPGGRLAARFGLVTSGAVAAYDAAGRLRFSGGLTARRGRELPSQGAEALASVLAGHAPATGSAAIFGCGMANAACLPAPRRAGP